MGNKGNYEESAVEGAAQGVDNQGYPDIKSLYFGARVLVTGATGFVGKVLIESLLRKTEVDKIYILIRSKRNKRPEERLEEILKDIVLTNLKTANPERLSAIVPITGDVALPDLGLSQEDEDRLVQEVEIVFHSAATVLFNENLKLAVDTNVRGTTGILDLARRMQNLKVVMHISTAYSNSHLWEIDEKIYPCEDGTDVIKLAESLSYETAHKITKTIIGDSINTYIYTKRATEDLIDKHYRDMPIGIFRPAIVIGAVKEPIPGYMYNMSGPVGVMVGMMTGMLHSIIGKAEAQADLVPVDMVANCLISAAWDTYTRYSMDVEDRHMPVYNMVSSPKGPITWGIFHEIILRQARQKAPSAAVWRPYTFPTNSWTAHRFLSVFLHYIPAYLLDTFLVLSGKKKKYVHLYQKVDVMFEVFFPFLCPRKNWIFRNGNVTSLWERMSSKEQDLFPFNFKGFDWISYSEVYYKGLLQFILKDTITEKESKEKATRFYIYHCLLKSVLIALLTSVIFLALKNKIKLQASLSKLPTYRKKLK